MSGIEREEYEMKIQALLKITVRAIEIIRENYHNEFNDFEEYIKEELGIVITKTPITKARN